MAYVLGYLYADGSIIKSARGSYINVTSVDKSTIEKIKALLNSEHTIVEIKPKLVRFKHQTKTYKTRTAYLLRIGNQALYDNLINLGLYPDKSLTIKFPDVPSRALPHFVRGYFDGDGCVYLEMGKGISKPRIVKRLAVIFTSGSFDFVAGLQVALEKLGLKGRIYENNRAYRLRYTTGQTVKFFPILYSDSKGLYLQRKFDIFTAYFKLRPERINNSVKAVLVKIGHVAN